MNEIGPGLGFAEIKEQEQDHDWTKLTKQKKNIETGHVGVRFLQKQNRQLRETSNKNQWNTEY